MYNPYAKKILDKILSEIAYKPGRQLSFYARLQSNFPIIYQAFKKLYGHQYDIEKPLKDLVVILIEANKNRSQSLKALDDEREKYPTWFKSEQLAGMMFYLRQFAGNLEELEKKLPYFEELGINLLHIMPILKCPESNNDGGYAISDYRSIDPTYGNIGEVRSLADRMHKKKMLLMFDMVINHTSDEHEWAIKAKNGDPAFQNYYYTYSDRTIPDRFEASLPEVFPETSPGNFTYVEEMKKWVMTVFHHYQWDLNYTNPAVFNAMLENLLFLANLGVDIIRLDALAFMWKREGTDSQNLDEAHLLIQNYKACAQIVSPGVLFLAEAIVSPHNIVKYFGTQAEVSNECEIAYNATLMTLIWDMVATKNKRLLEVSLNHTPRKPSGTTWLNYIRCHDDIGLGYEDHHAQIAGYDPWSHRKFLTDYFTGRIDWSFAIGQPFMEDKKAGTARISGTLASLAGLEKALYSNDPKAIELAVSRILLVHSIIFSFGGIPLLYSGDEVGQLNDYSYQQIEAKKHDSRWLHRPKMDWAKAELRNETGTYQNVIFQSLKKMIAIRQDSPEFADNDNNFLVNCHNDHLLAYMRHAQDIKTLVICNLNDHQESVYMDLFIQLGFDLRAGVKDKYLGNNIDFSDYKIDLNPYQFMWITQC